MVALVDDRRVRVRNLIISLIFDLPVISWFDSWVVSATDLGHFVRGKFPHWSF